MSLDLYIIMARISYKLINNQKAVCYVFCFGRDVLFYKFGYDAWQSVSMKFACGIWTDTANWFIRGLMSIYTGGTLVYSTKRVVCPWG